MNAIQWIILVCHGTLTALVIVSFLCGNWPIFEDTFIQRINHFFAYRFHDYFLRFVGAVFGSKCTNAILSVENICCNRPNPLLQVILRIRDSDTQSIIYLAIIGGTYFLIVKYSFISLPGNYLSGIHLYTSSIAVCVGILLFLLSSFSDPGTVTDENVSNYLSAYPYDNVIFSEKECSTCKILKPARSKHCSICGHCIARFDHHCGWMNNCIGERNTRYFLAFLLWHFILCIYGIFAIGLVLAGRLKELRIIHILTVYYGIENNFWSLAPVVIQWLVNSNNTQILLMVFLTIVAMLLAGFFAYHVNLCLSNTTTNETFKWQDYETWRRKAHEARASAVALKESIEGMSVKPKPPESKWRAFFRRSPLENAPIVVKNNIYDKGVLLNLHETFVPLTTRPSFSSHSKMKSG